MTKKNNQTPAAKKSTPRRRNRLASDQGNGKFSRPLLAALIVILAGGAYLFWPRGGGTPAGIGEQLTVVTADSVQTNIPRSGTVDIDDEQQAVVAEQPQGQQEPPRQVEVIEEEPATVEPEVEKPAAKVQPKPQPKPATPKPEVPKIAPHPSGSWAVQIGAYESEINAEKLVGRLAEKNVTAHTRAASTSSGELIYRVWVGWFKNRQEALDYAKQERSVIGDSYPVHR